MFQGSQLSQIYFYLTEGCNLACRHCWLSPKFDAAGSRQTTLPVELFEQVIQEAEPLGLTRVKLTGGEPLLHPQFGKLLDILRGAEIGVTIETNGLLCTPDMASKIAAIPNRFVSVSLDGAVAATHDWVRGLSGAFDQTVQAIRNLTAVGIAPQIIMSLMRCNLHHIAPMVQMAEELGAASVKFNIIQPTGRGERFQNGTQGIEIQELIAAGRFVERELASRTTVRLLFDYPMAFRPLSRIVAGNGQDVCGILGILGVLPGGQYALCGIGEHLPELVFGVVGKDRLEDVWTQHPVLNAIRAGLPEQLDGVCARCLMKSRCFGTCLAQNYYRTGRLWSAYWFCEQAEAAGLFPEMRLTALECKF